MIFDSNLSERYNILDMKLNLNGYKHCKHLFLWGLTTSITKATFLKMSLMYFLFWKFGNGIIGLVEMGRFVILKESIKPKLFGHFHPKILASSNAFEIVFP